ncbi:MAG TPA: globin [Solirubrobacteraceae bacterium]
MATPDGIFERLGGLDGCRRLATTFYARVGRDERLRRLFPHDFTGPSERLALFIAEVVGGPELYSFARGRPRLRKRHERFAIGPTERDAWLEQMRAALDTLALRRDDRDVLGDLFEEAASSLVNDSRGGQRRRRARTDRNPIAGRHG